FTAVSLKAHRVALVEPVAYPKDSVKAHTKTETVYQTELKQGQDTEVKGFANQVLPIVAEHLQMAKTIVAKR
ncbi:MAG: hypothetical protein C4288_22800, partial [Leptolyngbya sp. ERB_1_1]